MLNPLHYTYYTYILTNRGRTVLYIGVTNNMGVRLIQHKESADRNDKSFTARYKCYFLIHYETFNWVNEAITREKELKGWSRKKKDELINLHNPNWEFLNHHFSGPF